MPKRKLTGTEKAALGCAAPVIVSAIIVGVALFAFIVTCAVLWKPS